MNDRGIRSLIHLQNSASTARVLNLLAIWRRHRDRPEYAQQPFFLHPVLNRAMLIKHRLRRDELDLFDAPQRTATKIIFPIDHKDLKLGGHSVFVGQRNFANLLDDMTGRREIGDTHDMQLLHLLDDLPSLDPFLLREHLKRCGFEPASCYFELSDGDLKKIFSFVQTEIEPLIRISLGGKAGHGAQSSKLVSKILANTLDNDMEPLRLVLRLSEAEFSEGIFCWKGFLYYKWAYRDTAADARQVIEQIMRIAPRGAVDVQTRAAIDRSRTVVTQHILRASEAIRGALSVYDKAYGDLIQNQNPVAFRDFLLDSPALFTDLGESLGLMQHVISFWRFRFSADRTTQITPEELMDIFTDFEGNLSNRDRHDEVRAVA